MVDTARTLAALQTLLADNTSGDISPQDVRDMLLSLFTSSTKGDLQGIASTGVQAALTIGANDEVLVADSGETLGMKWATGVSIVGDPYLFTEIGTPANPSQNSLKLFARANGGSIELVARSSEGQETILATLLDGAAAPANKFLLLGVKQ